MIGFFYMVPVALFSLVAHEWCHAYAALRQGDTTARDAGRLTWDPGAHIDPIFTVLLPLLSWWAFGVLLGSAKPLRLNPLNYHNRGRGELIVSLAGPAANVVLVALFYALTRALPADSAVHYMADGGMRLNAMLAIFNLLPIPPLDGWRAVMAVRRIARSA